LYQCMNCAVQVDLEKKTALGNMLQEVARSLQSKNKQILEQLDLRSRHEKAESNHKEELESVVQKITQRFATPDFGVAVWHVKW
jgi:hypothetical protein